MPSSSVSPRKSRLIWAVVLGLFAVILFIGNVAGNLIAADLDAVLRPYRLWVWVFFGTALIIAVTIAIREALREDTSQHPSVNVDRGEHHSSTDKNKTAKPDQIIHVYNAPAPTGSALHQLPTPPADFTGREKELDELMRALEGGGVTISGLQGLGGVGKTTLALKLAQPLTQRYPDAQFYIDLKGTSKTPLSPADAMAHIVRAYQPTAKLPESEAELGAIYRSLLHNQRALLLMDNASDRNQVEPLIPPESCVMLVTSRQHFTLPGLFAKNLDALPVEDAQKLLLKIASRIGEQAGEIARLCGYLPLALRLAGSALAERVNLPVADYVRRLADAQQRLRLIDASLSLSYELLPPKIQERWRILAVFPGTFESEAAGALWGLKSDAAQDALGELIKYSLLEWDETTARYRLHDLARLFADAHLGEVERHAGRMRHASHYLKVLGDADNLYLKGDEALKRGLVLFDLEWPNIQVGRAWAEEHSGEDDEAAKLCSNYSVAGAYLLDLRQLPRERLNRLEVALAAARRLKDRKMEAECLGNLGLAYADLGELRRAIELFEQHMEIAREFGDRIGEYKDLNHLGMAYARLGETRRAIELFEQALVTAREANYLRGEGTALGNLGVAYSSLGETQRAIELYEQRLAIAQRIGDKLGESVTLGNLGVVYHNLGETQRAMELHRKRLTIAREIGDLQGEGSALWNMSLTLDQLDERDKAITTAESALGIFEQLEHPSVTKVRKKLAEWRGQGSGEVEG